MGGRAGVRPAMRLMTVVLSNGATLRLPTAAPRARPYFATQDLFQHNVWAVKTKGAEAAAASRVRTVDFSDFYRRFGGLDGGSDDGAAASAAGDEGSSSGSSSSSGDDEGGSSSKR